MSVIKQICLIFSLCIISYVGANTNQAASSVVPKVKSNVSAGQKMMGGWYPVFFNEYDESKVQSIIKNIQSGRVAKVIISYDLSYDLAKKILTNIKAQTTLDIEFKQVKPEDSTAQFNHKLVVVTVYNLVN